MCACVRVCRNKLKKDIYISLLEFLKVTREDLIETHLATRTSSFFLPTFISLFSFNLLFSLLVFYLLELELKRKRKSRTNKRQQTVTRERNRHIAFRLYHTGKGSKDRTCPGNGGTRKTCNAGLGTAGRQLRAQLNARIAGVTSNPLRTIPPPPPASALTHTITILTLLQHRRRSVVTGISNTSTNTILLLHYYY